jgi:hypothetical protein
MCFVEVVVAGAAAAEAHVLTDEGVLLLTVALPELLFLVRSVAA